MLPVILSEAAGATGLQTIHVLPEMRRLNEAANSLPVNIILRGEYLSSAITHHAKTNGVSVHFRLR